MTKRNIIEVFEALRKDLGRRLTWREYFMLDALSTSMRSSCDRARVGAVFVRENKILVKGYNSSPKGLPVCDDVGHLIEDGHCIRTRHAEANAVQIAVSEGISLRDTDLYITTFPCYNCFKLVADFVNNIFYMDKYRPHPQVFKDAKDMNIGLAEIKLDHLQINLDDLL